MITSRSVSLEKIRGRIAQQPTVSEPRYQLVDDTLFYREAGHASEWKPVLPACLEERAIQYTHTSLGHLWVEKCMQQIKQAYHLKNLGHKVRKFIACCDTCQRVMRNVSDKSCRENQNTFHFFFAVALRPNAGHGLLILEVSRSHTTTHHSR